MYEHPELRNLIPDLKADEVDEFGQEVLESFKQDEESRQEWLGFHADWIRLYFQKDHPKAPPWEGSSEESIPILAEACNQFHARAFQAMFPHNKVIKAVPTGMPDSKSKARSERVGTHMSWQLTVKDRGYKRNKDRLLLSLPLHGSMFTKSYWCPVRKRNITDNVRATDFSVPYGTGPRDLKDLGRKTQISWTPMHEARAKTKNGFFSKEPVPFEEKPLGGKSEPDQAIDDVEGMAEPGYADKGYAKILEQHCFKDLDGDGFDEPYIVWVDATSEETLRVAVRWETDEQGTPIGKNWYNAKAPVEYFTHYSFLENPDGFYGLGFGHLIGGPNTAVNKLIRQIINAGTLSTVGNASGFIDERLATKKGESRLQLGKFIKTPSSVDDLRKGIYQFSFPGPDQVLSETATLLMARADRLATVTEAITGQTEKVMQPTTILALIEQSLQVFSAVYERVLHAWGDELEIHYRLNRKFMDPKEYFSVLDTTGEMQDAEASREDYEDDLQVRPVADPKMSTERQKLARAEAEYNIALANPLVISSPIHFYNVSKRYFEAIGSEAIDEILPKPEDATLRVDDPYQENMGALSPIPIVPPAHPEQDHNLHIKAHHELLNDEVYGTRLSDAGRQQMEQHIDAHAAMMYGQTESPENVGRVGLDLMEEEPGNAGVPEGANGAVQAQPGLEVGGLLGEGEPPEGAV